jgi:predicted amidohydrolase YtcJ
MQMVFVNGTIHTMEPDGSDATWARVLDGIIDHVGRGAPDVAGADVFDLKGRSLLPGFQDAHVHPPHGGMAMIRCDLHGLRDLGEYQAAIVAYGEAHTDRLWITGGGWPMETMPGGIARAEWIDAVLPDRPVLLTSSEGHAAWANTRALEIAGIDATTPDPPDGRIERDPDGTPNGTLQEGAEDLVARHAPAEDVADYVEAILAAQDHLIGLGITALQDAWVTDAMHEAYRSIASEGRLLQHVTGALWWDRSRGIEQLAGILDRSRQGVGRYVPAAVKLMIDGVCENGTAAMVAPYADTDDTGITFIDRETLLTAVPRIMASGLQPHFHAIGDGAIRDALDAVAGGDPSDIAHTRPHIAHIQVIDPADVGRFAHIGVAANAQALWACNDGCMRDLTAPRLGSERTAWQYPFRSLLDTGALLAGGSDWSVSTADVFAQIAVAVTRTARDNGGAFLPHQAITPYEALRAFTMGSAFVNHRDHLTGSIAVGKHADLVVASADPLVEHDIGGIEVDATFIRGEQVFGRDH